MSERAAASDKLRIAVLASGSGTTLQAVIDACESGRLDAVVVLVVSNNSRSGVIARARRHGIASLHLSSRTHADPDDLDRAVASALKDCCPDLVLLAGYMKRLGPKSLAEVDGRVINTHPSLLPRFGGQGMYGERVHQAVIDKGVATTGISVHLVDAEYDTGRVLAQRQVQVEEGDDAAALARRVQSIERPFLIEVIGRIASGAIRLGAKG